MSQVIDNSVALSNYSDFMYKFAVITEKEVDYEKT